MRLRLLGLLLVLASTPATAAQLLLAASWQPAFCEVRTRAKECRTQTTSRFDASHFALHGLWPQPRDKVYCGVDQRLKRTDKQGRWRALPALPLKPAVREALRVVMPGVASGLHRHEWFKHGTCYQGRSAGRYFADSLALMKALNASAVRTLFTRNIGGKLHLSEVRRAFDRSFGAGAGKRVRMQCKRAGGRTLITELHIALATRRGTPALDQAIHRGTTLRSRCTRGEVDAVGVSPKGQRR